MLSFAYPSVTSEQLPASCKTNSASSKRLAHISAAPTVGGKEYVVDRQVRNRVPCQPTGAKNVLDPWDFACFFLAQVDKKRKTLSTTRKC
jgi:hypothetical protein